MSSVNHLSEIFFLDNVARQDVFTNVATSLSADVWKYGVMPPAANYDIEDPTKFWYTDMNKNMWTETLFQDIVIRLGIVSPATNNYNFKMLDVKAGAKTFGQDGSIHIDKDFEFNVEGDGYMTFCYFPHTSWEPEWGGEFQFLDTSGNIIASYYPMPNTCLVFDSNLPHRGLAPRMNSPELRKYVSFKCFVHKNWETPADITPLE
jgi:hypothetical protein